MGGVNISLEESGRKELIALLRSISTHMPTVAKRMLSLICSDIIAISQTYYVNGPRIKGGGHIQRQSGKLANSLSYKLLGSMDAEIGTDLVYAAIHEFGGDIYPVNKKTLHWQDENGNDIFAKHVKMPARPYLKPAIDREFSTGRAMRIAEQAMSEYLAQEVRQNT